MRKDRENFLDEDVLRIQNEVRRYLDEQERIHDGNVADKMQWLNSTGSDTHNVSDKSRSNFLQDAPPAAKR